MYLIALSPIIILFILSLTRGVKTAVWITGVLTSCLFFYWGASWSHYIAVLGISALTSLNILMIVFGATFLYNIMSGAGLIDEMSHSLDGLGSNTKVRFFLIAFGMTAFFEGVAGFGTPGAIVPLILIAMRYDPIRSVSTVLLFGGLFSAFGAIGTPLISGLQQPLALDYDAVKYISLLSAVLLSLVGLLAVFVLFGGKEKTG